MALQAGLKAAKLPYSLPNFSPPPICDSSLRLPSLLAIHVWEADMKALQRKQRKVSPEFGSPSLETHCRPRPLAGQPPAGACSASHASLACFRSLPSALKLPALCADPKRGRPWC